MSYCQDIIEIISKQELIPVEEVETKLMEIYDEIDLIEYEENIRELLGEGRIMTVYKNVGELYENPDIHMFFKVL